MAQSTEQMTLRASLLRLQDRPVSDSSSKLQIPEVGTRQPPLSPSPTQTEILTGQPPPRPSAEDFLTRSPLPIQGTGLFRLSPSQLREAEDLMRRCRRILEDNGRLETSSSGTTPPSPAGETTISTRSTRSPTLPFHLPLQHPSSLLGILRARHRAKLNMAVFLRLTRQRTSTV